MAREIRITVDDDEVFERMKARKRELDLSWEEVLHRGLRRDEEGVGSGRDERRGYERAPPDPISAPGAFAEDLKRQIQGQVRDSLHASLESTWEEPYRDDPLGRDVETLESAEDAVLVFGFLEDGGASAQVPLRVTLEAGAEGLTAEVVAVRQGKGVAAMNTFEPATRRRIVEGLATGEVATLEFDAGAEIYPVVPTLAWSRDDGGRPTVVDVTIDEVRFDAD
ncbi:hypothetical protein [Natrononativus amylolyticus]|uniref:hypothetical protein n=1 Tax=Natrononativus amylolyticus TaxID=2963434 RepID=UPI0020CFC372|nr:hypothetical protein [Natrononativus amylolyticus]